MRFSKKTSRCGFDGTHFFSKEYAGYFVYFGDSTAVDLSPIAGKLIPLELRQSVEQVSNRKEKESTPGRTLGAEQMSGGGSIVLSLRCARDLS